MSEIVAVRYGLKGISHVKLDNGRVLDMDMAIQAVKQGQIDHVTLGSTRGEEPHYTLRTFPDSMEESHVNLSDLPRF